MKPRFAVALVYAGSVRDSEGFCCLNRYTCAVVDTNSTTLLWSDRIEDTSPTSIIAFAVERIENHLGREAVEDKDYAVLEC